MTNSAACVARGTWRFTAVNYRIGRLALALMSLVAQPVEMFSQTQPATSNPHAPVDQGSATDDIEVLVRRMLSSGAAQEKSEFETTAQFNARQSSAIPIGERVRLSVGTGLHVSMTYDADAGQLLVVARTEELASRAVRNYADAPRRHDRTIVLKSTLKSSSSYPGTNSFGVSRQIERSTYEDFGIVLTEDSEMQFTSKTTFTFDMNADQARLLKPHLRLLIEGTIARSELVSDHHHTSATVASPYDMTVITHLLPVRVSALALVDGRTGAIISRVDAQAQQPVNSGCVSPGPARNQKTSALPTRATILREVQPVYPPLARQARITGDVKFIVTVGPSGCVEDIRFVTGHPLLYPSAIEALRQYKFEPAASAAGTPIRSDINVTIPFRLTL